MANIVAGHPNTLVRRRTYAARLQRPDFFVLRHLTRFLDNAVEQFVTKGCRVGDIGCGEGPLRTHIEARGGRYTGIDINQNTQGSVQVIADITDIPLPDCSFDVILCTEVLEHVSDTHRAFYELTRLVKPGGYIILTTPFIYPLHEEPFDFVRLTPYQVLTLAERNYLRVQSLLTLGNELEVMATTLDNMWIRMGDAYHPLLRVIRLISRVVTNSVVLVAAAILRDALPRKSFVSIACTLRKREDHPANGGA